MKMPEFMTISTNNLLVEGINDLLKTQNAAEREGQALAISSGIEDMQMDFFTFLKSTISTLAIINMVRDTHPTSQDIERIEVLIREVLYEMGLIAKHTSEIKYLKLEDSIDDSFIRLCEHMERVDFTVNPKDEYAITFTDGKISIK